MGSVLPEGTTELSQKYEALEGTGPEPFAAFQALKEKIKLHYDVASDYYLSLWGEHIHHGYFTSPTQTKEDAQVQLINLLLSISGTTSHEPSSDENTSAPAQPPSNLNVLDVGCGLGGTSRHLARHLGATVTGITISTKQVEIARRLSLKEQESTGQTNATTINKNGNGTGEEGKQSTQIYIGSNGGSVRFLELDAEKMGDHFTSSSLSSGGTNAADFDMVWITEALSHFPNKPLFFQNAIKVLRPGGKLMLADWFKDEGLSEQQFGDDIKPIEDGMLLPPLCTQAEYVGMAEAAGLKVVGGPKDISQEVAKTWDISWSLVQNPSLWAFAFSQGRDGLAFLQAFRAMRRGYANGTFRYAVVAFEK